MIKLYKGYRLGYFASAFLGAIAIMGLCFFAFPQVDTLTIILVASIYIIGVALAFQYKVNKKYRGYLDLMTQRCQAQSFIDASAELLNAHKRLDNNLQAMLKMNICAAHLNLHQSEQASQIMTSIDCNELRGKQAKANIEYLIALNQTIYYCQDNNAKEAEEWLSKAKQMLTQPPFTAESSQQHAPALTRAQARIHVLNNQWEQAEEIFANDLENSNKMLQKVIASYHLGIIYANTDRPKKEHDAYKYASDNGGDTIYAQIAAQQLAHADDEYITDTRTND